MIKQKKDFSHINFRPNDEARQQIEAALEHIKYGMTLTDILNACVVKACADVVLEYYQEIEARWKEVAPSVKSHAKTKAKSR